MTADPTEKPSRSPWIRRPSARNLAFFVGLGLIATSAAMAQWKWKDASGRVQYSDRPPPTDISPSQVLQKPPGAQSSQSAVVIQPLRNPEETAKKASRAGTDATGAPTAASAPATKASDAARAAREKEAQALAQAERQKQEADLARQRSENCTRARQNLRTLESGMRIARVNDKGEREFLTDAQRTQETGAAQRAVANDCH